MQKRVQTAIQAIGFFGVFLMILPIGILAYTLIFPEGALVNAEEFNTDKENKILLEPIFTAKEAVKFKDPFLAIKNEDLNEPPLQFEVPIDNVVTTGATIRIPSIGVSTTIYESQNAERALEYGVWRDPLHGTPDRFGQPIVMAAHRWGSESLSWEWRYQNLFNKFDQLKVGETVEITWNNKSYTFKIRQIDQNFVVTQYSDLILYTCVYYGSPERYIVYADRI